MAAHIDIDQRLASGRRTLRTRPKSHLLGSTGARMWADVLDAGPGFSGAIDFIHKTNIPMLFVVDASEPADFQSGDVQWMPSHLKLRHRAKSFRFAEDKFIAWEDVAVSCQTWENIGASDLVLRLRVHPDVVQVTDANGMPLSGVCASSRGFRIRTAVAAAGFGPDGTVVVKPGETARLVVAAALGIEGEDAAETLARRAASFAEQPFDSIVPGQQAAYAKWFEQVPAFESDDDLLNKTWAYRWFLMRHNLADPRYGLIREPLFYEGRSHKMTKDPFSPQGWEFSKLIPLTQPMHLLEARWHHDASYGSGIFRNMAASQGEDGRYNCLFVDELFPHSYANFMGWASYQYYLVHRNEEAARRVLPSLKRQIAGEGDVYGSPADRLLIEYNHKRTGKEYQPSYWYFHDYPQDCMDESTYTPLKRVDRSIYHYLNCMGVAKLCELIGDPDAEAFAGLADRIKQDVLAKMWDEDERFFFDLHHETDEKAYVKNIVGFYPFWAGITDEPHRDSIRYLFDERAFGTPCPFPSVSVDCPIYTAEGGWQGTFIKGRNGCVWNGPTWPYTNSIVLDGLASESKRSGHAYDGRFGALLREYAWLHYSQRDMGKPYLVEHYNSQTGEAISDDVDYNHSYFIDLVIRHVAGLNAEAGRLVLDPVDIGLAYFSLSNVKVADHIIEVTYGRPGAEGIPVPEGLRVIVDGKEAACAADLQKVEVTL